jgi:NADH:ubiquinone oxidoreductase subunit E
MAVMLKTEKKGQELVVAEILERHHGEAKALLPVLREAQAKLHHLSEDVLKQVALGLNLPLSQVFGTATFYTMFNVRKKGQHIIRVCESAPCHVEGAQEVIEALEKELGVGCGNNTSDGVFTLETASCIGVCGVAPAIMIDDVVYGNLTPGMIPSIIARYRKRSAGKEG